MVTVNLHDEVTLERLDTDARSMYAILWHPEAKQRSEIDWSITNDLAVRAHHAVEEHVGRKLPVKMRLDKRIPVGGGLGGGSSNAAAMLRATNELFELKLDHEQLAKIGQSLGSDVPFLVCGGSAVVEGLGERLQPMRFPTDMHAVLVLPSVACPTGAVYRAFDALVPQAVLQTDRVHSMAARSEAPAMHEPFNDLAEPAFEVAPKLRGEREEISELIQRPVHVSGSGSTLFFLCNGPAESELLADAVARHMSIPAIPVQGVATQAPTWLHRQGS